MPVVDDVVGAGVFRRGGFLAEDAGFATFVYRFGIEERCRRCEVAA